MFTFRVTQERIAEATANDSSHCMVAESLKDAFPDARYVNVDMQTIRFTRLDLQKRYLFITPPNVIDMIVAFDAGDRGKIKPFTVKLLRGQAYPLLQRTGGIPQKVRYAGRVSGEPLKARLEKVIEDHPGITRNSLRSDVLKDVKAADLDEAIDSLEEDGIIQRRTTTRSGQKTQAFYSAPQQERIVRGNLRNSRYRRFGVRCLRPNQ